MYRLIYSMISYRYRKHTGRALLVVLLVVGLMLAIWQPVEPSDLLEWGRWLTARPYMLVLLVGVMALMFTFALPGSLLLWLVAPFQPPLLATAVLVAGSVLGAWGAYRLSKRLGAEQMPMDRGGQVRRLLSADGGLLTQCALRVLPGFPHSVVNYAGGLLCLPLAGFLGAAALGLAVKWGVYATAIHRGVSALESGEAIAPADVLPLLVLAALLAAGAWAQRRLGKRTP
jgi:uncharacterized membrane protein YdjX (TVP38/TMEM64 family)